MKKLLLFSAALTLACSAFAQKNKYTLTPDATTTFSSLPYRGVLENTAAKTAGLSDSFFLVSQAQYREIFDTATRYRFDAANPLDSGYATGTNPFGWSAYAEKFRFGNFGGDTTFRIIGFVARFTGRVNPATNKTITVNVWKEGAQTQFGTKKFNEGFPAASMKAQTYSIKNLGIHSTGGGLDTVKAYYFTTPLTGVNYDFFLGYEMNYAWNSMGGDTVALRSSRDNRGFGTIGGINSSQDTILFNKNVFRDGTTWKDFWWELDLDFNLSIVPIFQYSASTIGVGITRGNLTFFGSYPNPATNSSNIKFNLNKSADITVQIVDINGRVLNTIKENNLSAGEHIIPVNLSNIPAGTYTYIVSTSNGDAMAAKMSVLK